jgi:hypothetical protein
MPPEDKGRLSLGSSSSRRRLKEGTLEVLGMPTTFGMPVCNNECEWVCRLEGAVVNLGFLRSGGREAFRSLSFSRSGALAMRTR